MVRVFVKTKISLCADLHIAIIKRCLSIKALKGIVSFFIISLVPLSNSIFRIEWISKAEGCLAVDWQNFSTEYIVIRIIITAIKRVLEDRIGNSGSDRTVAAAVQSVL